MIVLVVALLIIGALGAACAWLYNRVSQLEKRVDVNLGLSCEYKDDMARLESHLDEVDGHVASLIGMAMQADAANMERESVLMFCDALGSCAPPRQRDGGEVEEMPPEEGGGTDAEPAAGPEPVTVEPTAAPEPTAVEPVAP